MGRERSSAEARETEERGSERLSGCAETHSGISPLALPISGVLHWPPQPSRKRYRINVSLITYTASARTPTLSWRKRTLSSITFSLPSSLQLFATSLVTAPLSLRRHVLKKQTFITTKKAAIARRRRSSFARPAYYFCAS